MELTLSLRESGFETADFGVELPGKLVRDKEDFI